MIVEIAKLERLIDRLERFKELNNEDIPFLIESVRDLLKDEEKYNEIKNIISYK